MKDGAGVVVALGAQRSTDDLGTVVVAHETRPRSAMSAPLPRRAGMARPPGPDGMDGPEARSGQCDEDRRILRHGFVDPLAPDEPGPDEVACVTSIHRGTRRALGLPPAPTGLEGDAVGKSGGREGQAPAGALSDDDRPPNADRMAAPPAFVTLGLECVELLGSDPSTNRPEHLPVVGGQLWGIWRGHGRGSSASMYHAHRVEFGKRSTTAYQRMPANDSEYQRTTKLQPDSYERRSDKPLEAPRTAR